MPVGFQGPLATRQLTCLFCLLPMEARYFPIPACNLCLQECDLTYEKLLLTPLLSILSVEKQKLCQKLQILLCLPLLCAKLFQDRFSFPDFCQQSGLLTFQFSELDFICLQGKLQAVLFSSPGLDKF